VIRETTIGFILALLVLSTLNAFPVQSQQNPTKFGINYLSTHFHYEQIYLDDDEINRDLSLFKERGFSFIILAAVWSYLEPEPAAYNQDALFSIKHICQEAAKYGLEVIVDFHTIMQAQEGQNYSWTMPEWLSPRLFNTVFENTTAKESWLNFLGNCTNYLKDVGNIHSWQMMNEPFIGTWAANASIDQFVTLWTEMKTTIKTQSSKPVTIRFAENALRSPSHFGYDVRIFDICDYIALNYYEGVNSSPQNLSISVSITRTHGKQIMISEFGLETNDDASQTIAVANSVTLFKSLGVEYIAPWYWRADHGNGNPALPGEGLNLAANTQGDPRPAFLQLSNSPPNVIPEFPAATTTVAIALLSATAIVAARKVHSRWVLQQAKQ
jgi:beta-glucosidase/6-phospho-beta-glucosidase/beta-galactosidase